MSRIDANSCKLGLVTQYARDMVIFCFKMGEFGFFNTFKSMELNEKVLKDKTRNLLVTLPLRIVSSRLFSVIW